LIDNSSPDPNAGDVWVRLRDTLAALGVDEQAFAAAAAEGLDGLRLLVARYISFPGARRYTPKEVYEKSGVDQGTAEALWRAMGFPLVPENETAFTDEDIEALRVATKLFDRAGMDQTIVLQQARSMGQAAARIAASHQDVIAEAIPEDDPAAAAEMALSFAEEALPATDHLLVYMYRRHLAAATEQRLLITPSEEGGVIMAVGFADLMGFTALSQELDVRELAALVDRFNAATADVVGQSRGRVIKTIGDEVMFATQDPGSAAAIALALINEISGKDGLPSMKVGVASGVVIAREGDLFGGPVNLANRLVTIAKPDSVLVDESTRDALASDERFHFTSVGKRYLKGFGLIRSFRLREAERPQTLGTKRRHSRPR
jgi:adenylate cyclase